MGNSEKSQCEFEESSSKIKCQIETPTDVGEYKLYGWIGNDKEETGDTIALQQKPPDEITLNNLSNLKVECKNGEVFSTSDCRIEKTKEYAFPDTLSVKIGNELEKFCSKTVEHVMNCNEIKLGANSGLENVNICIRGQCKPSGTQVQISLKTAKTLEAISDPKCELTLGTNVTCSFKLNTGYALSNNFRVGSEKSKKLECYPQQTNYKCDPFEVEGFGNVPIYIWNGEEKNKMGVAVEVPKPNIDNITDSEIKDFNISCDSLNANTKTKCSFEVNNYSIVNTYSTFRVKIGKSDKYIDCKSSGDKTIICENVYIPRSEGEQTIYVQRSSGNNWVELNKTLAVIPEYDKFQGEWTLGGAIQLNLTFDKGTFKFNQTMVFDSWTVEGKYKIVEDLGNNTYLFEFYDQNDFEDKQSLTKTRFNDLPKTEDGKAWPLSNNVRVKIILNTEENQIKIHTIQKDIILRR